MDPHDADATAERMICSELSLGELVAAQPGRAELFERLRLDYCCGGAQTLAQACERRGLDPETVCRMLEALEGAGIDHRQVEHNDWRRASIGQLCEHIVAAHHDRLRAELPRLGELLATVVLGWPRAARRPGSGSLVGTRAAQPPRWTARNRGDGV